MDQVLSKRGVQIKNFPNILATAFYRQSSDAYNKESNPDGLINLGTAENKLMYDLLSQKFQECSTIPEACTHYCVFHGIKRFKAAIAKLMDHFMKPVNSIKPDNVVVISGCGNIIEALGMLLADQGDGFMTTSPYYGAFKDFLKRRGGVELISVNLSSKPGPGENKPYELTLARLEDAYEKATNEGITIRAFILCNPYNPLGNIFSEKEVRDCLHFAHKHSIHVIVDEVYLLSIYKEGCTMPCVLSLDGIPDPERVHVVWGFSKDFCVSGFRCGVVYTLNKDVCESLKSMAHLQSSSTVAQHLLMNTITDIEWVDHVFVPTNHRRLRECNKIVCDTLDSLRVPYIDAHAGLYLWVDFRKFLLSQTFVEEWKLYEEFMSHKVYITPGQAFYSQEPGWFRIVFATDPSILTLAMERIKDCIREHQEPIAYY